MEVCGQHQAIETIPGDGDLGTHCIGGWMGLKSWFEHQRREKSFAYAGL